MFLGRFMDTEDLNRWKISSNISNKMWFMDQVCYFVCYFTVWVKSSWIIYHLKRPVASILPCLPTSCSPNACPPVVLSYCLPLLTAFCLCVFPVCTSLCSRLVKRAWPWWVLTTHPSNPEEKKGERLPQGRALLVWPNTVWHSQQHPFRLHNTVVIFLPSSASFPAFLGKKRACLVQSHGYAQ